jgi:superfamily I DNA/RNA helicase
VVDEVQDLKAAESPFPLDARPARPENFMVVGDAGQRIYPGGFSLRSLGIEVRGRSHILRINYRTTEQIRLAADRMLGRHVDDFDGGREERSGTRSLVSGPLPRAVFAGQLGRRARIHPGASAAMDRAGLTPTEIAVFVRTNSRAEQVATELERGRDVRHQFFSVRALFDRDGVRIGSMHRAKGLEFKAVIVAGCSEDHAATPCHASLDRSTIRRTLKKRWSSERRLLYVAMTRARDELVVTWSGEPSTFLQPLILADAA